MPDITTHIPTQTAADKFSLYLTEDATDAQDWVLARIHDYVLQKELGLLGPIHNGEISTLRTQQASEDSAKANEVDGWFT